MSSIDGGFLLLARRLTEADSWLMSKPPLYLKLWVWMLGRARWKDGAKLKRGQLITSIDEMREAMSYRIGYRKITPTKDEIRSAYRAFCENPHEDHTNPPMITTTKTTRGMIITICNYSKYQDFKNYEDHNEPHDENPAKPTATPHDREKMSKEERRINTSELLPDNSGSTPGPLPPEEEKEGKKKISSDALRLSGLLAELIAGNNPSNRTVKASVREKSIAKWAVDIDRMLRLDGRTAEETEAAIRWSQANEFWCCNIMSGAKLRKQYDKLILQMQRANGGNNQAGSAASFAAMGRRVY